MDAKPLLDVSACYLLLLDYLRYSSKGNEVVKVLAAGKGGKWTGEVLSRVLEWQLANPEGTKAQCEQWLRDEHTAGRVIIDVPSNNGQGQPKRGRNEESADGRGKPKK